MSQSEKGLIIYVVGKFPVGKEPKQGKYPAIFNGMLERGWDVLMLAHNSPIRSAGDSSKVTKFQNGKGILIENFSYTKWSKVVKKWMPFTALKKFILSRLDRQLVDSVFQEASGFIDKLPSRNAVIHVYGTQRNIGPKIAEKINEAYRFPIVLNVHGSEAYEWTNENCPNYYKLFLPKISFFAPVSGSLSDKWMSLYGNQINCLKAVVPNPVQPEVFELSKTESKNSNFTFIHVSKMDKNRNIEVIIDGFLDFVKLNPNSELWFIGGKPDEKLEEKISLNKAANHIKFLGRCSREAVATYMGKAHVFVHAASVETFGNPIVEALMTGIPVIVSKSGGPESIVSDKKYGIVLGEISSKSMTAAMTTVHDNYISFDKTMIRDYAMSNFSEQEVFNKLEKIYYSLKGGKN